jgi:hypothetical protein
MNEISREIRKLEKELQYYNSLLNQPGHDQKMVCDEIDYRLQVLEQLSRVLDQEKPEKLVKKSMLARVVSYLF